jgi:leader peptidase (prepilin peptidase)/N-methyltransferase
MDTIDSFGSRFVIYAIMMLMIIAALILIGLALGSFVNALMWRLHEQEIESVKKKTKKRTEYLKDLSITKGRSMCTHCHHQLAPKDLIPVVSWASLRGKCRYCKQPIADTPLAELLTPLLFVVSYYYWPVLLHGYGLISFLFWLPCIVGFVALSIYDIRWYLLPNRIVYPLFLLAIATTIIHIIFYRVY